MPEAESLLAILRVWRRPPLTFCRTWVTNARSEAAILTAKNLKRIGRVYTNHANYRTRILLYTAAQKAGEHLPPRSKWQRRFAPDLSVRAEERR